MLLRGGSAGQRCAGGRQNSKTSVQHQQFISTTSSCGLRSAVKLQVSFATQESSTAAPAAANNSNDNAVTATRQTYIQESINFTGAELAARLPSMQAALRAQRDAAAAAASAAANALGRTFGSNSSSGGPRAPAVPPVPPVTRPGPHPAAGGVAAAAAGGPSPAAPYSNNTNSSINSGMFSSMTMSPMAAAAAATTSTMQVAEAPTAYTNSDGTLNLLPQQDDDVEDIQPQQEEQQQPPPEEYYSPPAPSAAYSNGDSSSSGGGGGMSLQGMSASEKMQALQQVQQASRQALTKLPNSNPYYANAPKTIDIRMYDQLVVAHNKQSAKLSDINSHVAVLEGQINQCNEDLIAAFELLKQIAMEFGTTSRLAQGTAAAVQFGVDPQDALDKISALQERLSTLEQAVLEQRAEFGKRVVRKVPVEWIGVASEVKVMGDFDDWTRGQELSAEDVASDSVYCRFEGTLLLRPGQYRVKFLVDNEWRLAADWPTERDADGNEVCLLTVA